MEHWYAIYTRPRHEKKVYEGLIEKEITAYLPLIKRVRQWKDRKKKVDMPLFSSYLFVRIDYKNRFDVLQTKGVVKIVNFNGVPAVIPDWQIESLKQMLEHPEKIQLENYIKPGELVVIEEGPFRGLKGMVKSLRGKTRLVVSIEGIMQTVSVEIDSDYVKKVRDPQEPVRDVY
ncbi:UpxY family transcription antiterminator [Caldithrix abyssi]|uniref:NusG antitermination factor n=1 Tax=Caldithrix abyssi DSM 13497 TaxID=880073 RepID=H1XXJ1_CALAY|nr:UpxY family transcription antiterminator [Caldithrix abyssi]APF19204.1 transcription elongation factor/antiterminator RfaH [Caldithrix abyssi DSM 13497]EHO43115.1 NusG antitermination factor [Caldithrix abyssi DSM 13497]